jgi:hypothetical protein
VIVGIGVRVGSGVRVIVGVGEASKLERNGKCARWDHANALTAKTIIIINPSIPATQKPVRLFFKGGFAERAGSIRGAEPKGSGSRTRDVSQYGHTEASMGISSAHMGHFFIDVVLIIILRYH